MNWTIVGLRAMLMFVLYTQVTHQRISLGDPTLMNYFMAITIELSISVIASAVLSIIMGSDNPWRFIALAALPALFWCMSISYEASVSVFTKNRLDQVRSESKSLAQTLSEQKAIRAHNAMSELSSKGITSGAQYEAATDELESGMAMMEESSGTAEASTTALAMTGGDGSDEAVNAKALEMAKLRAKMLIVLTLALSGLSGLWTGVTSGFARLSSSSSAFAGGAGKKQRAAEAAQ